MYISEMVKFVNNLLIRAFESLVNKFSTSVDTLKTPL